jgi:membrane protein YdbS with pleckstrin-like domain
MSSREELSEDLQGVLTDGEDVRWHGVPDRRALIVGFLVGAIPSLLFFGPMVFIPTMLVVTLVGVGLQGGIAYLLLGFLVAALVTLLVVFGGSYLIAKRTYDFAEYAITDERLVAFGGIVGRDYSTVDWANVEDVEVDVGFVDDRYGTGTVSAVTAGSGGVSFSGVADPYDVLDTIESVRRGGSP